MEITMIKKSKKTLREADTPVDYTEPTKSSINWDDIFSDDTTSSLSVDPRGRSISQSQGDEPVPHMHLGSSVDTHNATAGMSPTDSIRDMMNKINVSDDAVAGEPETLPVPHHAIEPEQVPTVISRQIAMTDPHAVNPTWHTVANLPGNLSRAILTLGKALFRAFTRTRTEDIAMIGNVGGQGPNSTREVRSVAAWVERHGTPVDDATIDFNQTIPGYTAEVKHYVAGGIRFKLVRDQFGDYIYAWPESDSISSAAHDDAALPAAQLGRPHRSLSRR